MKMIFKALCFAVIISASANSYALDDGYLRSYNRHYNFVGYYPYTEIYDYQKVTKLEVQENLKVEKGNRDIIQNETTWVEAYRLINGLGIPEKLAPYIQSYAYEDCAWHCQEWVSLLKTNYGNEYLSEHTYRTRGTKYNVTIGKNYINKYGKDHPYVKEWFSQQVIANSTSKDISEFIYPPQNKPLDSAEIVKLRKYDREYQYASAFFNRRKFDIALTKYEEISQNAKSPYKAMAVYMAARTKLAKHQYDKAYNDLKETLDEPSLAEIHTIARALIGTVADRSEEPEYGKEQFIQIMSPLSAPMTDKAAEQDLTDNFNKLNYDMWFYLGYHGIHDAGIQALSKDNDLLDWILTFTQGGLYVGEAHWGNNEASNCLRYKCRYIPENTPPALLHSYNRWKETNKLTWLIAFMLRIPHDNEHVNEVLSIYDKLEKKVQSNTATDSELYAFPTIQHHALRLMIHDESKAERVQKTILKLLENEKESGPRIALAAIKFWISNNQLDLAKPILDKATNLKFRINDSKLAIMQLLYAKTIDEVLAIQKRLVDAESAVSSYTFASKEFDLAVYNFLNLLSVNDLIQAASSDNLSKHQSEMIYHVAWVRSVLLKKYDTATSIAHKIVDITPELKPFLQPFIEARSEQEKERLALYTLLKNPGLKPIFNGFNRAQNDKEDNFLQELDDYNPNDNNWWCNLDPKVITEDFKQALYQPVLRDALYEKYSYTNELIEAHKDKYFSNHALLNLADEKELQELAQTGYGTTYLGEKTLEWLNDDVSFYDKHLNINKQSIEAAHLYVKATRYGCRRDFSSGYFSKKVFKKLHTLKNNDWAKRTPYWFSNF